MTTTSRPQLHPHLPRVHRSEIGPVGRGILAMAPVAAGLFPFAVGIGAAIATSPLGDVVGLASGPLLFAGSTQIAVIELLGAGAGAVSVLGTVIALTARFALYGAALAPTLADQPRWFRVVAPYFLVDPLMTTVADMMTSPTPARTRRAHYLGAATTLWIVWLAGMVLGVMAVPRVGATWSLDLAAPLCLVALLGRKLGQPSARTPVLVAAVACAVGALAGLGPGVLTLAATVAGAAAGGASRRDAR